VNERLTFPIAVIVGEVFASVGLFLAVPGSPLTSRFDGMLEYAGGHGFAVLVVWVGVVGFVSMLAPRVWRRRQNESTKVRVLAWVGLVGLAIDGLVSVYLVIRGGEMVVGGRGVMALHMGLRMVLYGVGFAGVVAGARWLAGRRQPPAVTPPPRFGRV
jgi:cytochrome c oxidase assembly factor CtaG